VSGKTVVPEEAVEAACEQLDAMGVSVSKKYMRAALEAAAPFIAAKALEDAADALGDGLPVYASNLRARAAAVRGEG
jgi:hypothetical protein